MGMVAEDLKINGYGGGVSFAEESALPKLYFQSIKFFEDGKICFLVDIQIPMPEDCECRIFF